MYSIYKDLDIYFCDNNFDMQGKTISNIEVLSPERAFELKDTVIIVGSLVHKDSIYQQISENGYPMDKVCIADFRLQYFDYFEPEKNEVFVDAGCFD